VGSAGDAAGGKKDEAGSGGAKKADGKICDFSQLPAGVTEELRNWSVFVIRKSEHVNKRQKT
jgi:hypothetical protein